LKAIARSPKRPSARPQPRARTFVSPAVERTIERVKREADDPDVAWMFENCYPNTLDTTVKIARGGRSPDTFVITGDIHALWLRDSTAQVWPYMRLVAQDPSLQVLVKGLVLRQMACVLLDPYANSFMLDPTTVGWETDRPANKPGVHERKWELDSLCYVIRLAHEYWRITGDDSIFTARTDKALRLAVATMRTEQRLDGSTPYRFERTTSQMIDAPPFGGIGHPVRPTGMIASAFRPSDDSTLLPFLVPSNLFAIQELRHLADIYTRVYRDSRFARDCLALAGQVESAVREHGIVRHREHGKIWAYEVDGYGNHMCIDDANVPSLMSLPYLGICRRTDPLYRRTRRFLLSDANPYFLRGRAAQGQASPHTGRENIWPMGIILRGLTSVDKTEIDTCVAMLTRTHAGTGLMHESFHKDDASRFTRSWFAWANTLFGELILDRWLPHHTRRS
jgi:meiotically up-regulated gene 157 (Mug157) protein